MALAYLCRQWEKTHSCDDVAVTAFVVDHKAREESSREAATVTRWLTDLGMCYKRLVMSKAIVWVIFIIDNEFRDPYPSSRTLMAMEYSVGATLPGICFRDACSTTTLSSSGDGVQGSSD